MTPVAIEDFTELLTASGDWVISAYSISVPAIGSLKARAEGSPILKDGVNVTIITITAASPTLGAFIQTSPAVFSINSSANKTRVEGDPPILEGDESDSIIVSGNITPPGGSLAPGTISVTLKVQVAGQTKVSAS